jgi:precorrin-6A/cobalt-precorrin-6A reductase
VFPVSPATVAVRSQNVRSGVAVGHPRTIRILLLAGSSEASTLARRLSDLTEFSVVTSFAGRVSELSLPPGDVRIGGFGGPEGLAAWITDHGIDAVLDATHPFTARMPRHVVLACESTGVPHLRVLRPAWVPEPGDRWSEVADFEGAARSLRASGARRVFLTIGRQELRPFADARPGTWFLVRCIERPDPVPLADYEVLLSRGPFRVDDEVALLRTHRIDTLVTKNSGGSAAAPKLEAARTLEVPVVMIARPPTSGPSVGSPDQALQWCTDLLGRLRPPDP